MLVGNDAVVNLCSLCKCAWLAGLHMLKTSCASVYCFTVLLGALPSLSCTCGKWLQFAQVSLVCGLFSIPCQLPMSRVPHLCFQGCTALHIVAEMHCRDAANVVKLLLARGADATAKNTKVSDQVNMVANVHQLSPD